MDVDLVVRMTHVYADGRSMLLVDGARRASLRNGFATRELLQPATSYAVEVDLAPIAVTIPVGDRLRIAVASSCYDRWDKNMQDGSSLSDAAGATTRTAHVRLLLNSGHASTLEVPAISAMSVRKWHGSQ